MRTEIEQTRRDGNPRRGGINAVLLEDIQSGTRPIKIWARDEDDFVYYSYSGTVQVLAYSSVAPTYEIPWAVGSVSVLVTLIDGVDELTCAEAGLTDLVIDLVDQNGDPVYAEGYTRSCTTEPFYIDYLDPGRYWIYVSGDEDTGTAGYEYQSDWDFPPYFDVIAGDTVLVDVDVFYQL